MAVEEQSLALTVSIVRPLVTPKEAQQAAAEYEALKTALIRRPDDVQIYQGREFLRKSFWRRIAVAFGLSVETVSEHKFFNDDGHLCYAVIERASAPNGRFMTGDGFCTTAERGHGDWPEHTVRAVAHTRARNRAISDLIGGGEVSAEEMDAGNYVDSEPPRRPPQQQQNQQRRLAPTVTEHQTTNDDISVGEFVREAAKLGLTSLQLAEKIGIPQGQFSQMSNRREVIEAVRKDMEANSATVVDEEPPPTDQPAAPDWNYIDDLPFRKRAEKLGYKTDAQVRKIVMKIDPPTPRRSIIMNYILAQETTPDLAGQPTGGQA